jgi:hypothetical protein
MLERALEALKARAAAAGAAAETHAAAAPSGRKG